MKIVFFIISIFFILSCSHNYTLKPCIKTDLNRSYSKLIVSKKAKVKILAPFAQELSLYSDEAEYQMLKSFDGSFESNVGVNVGSYHLNPILEKVANVTYVWDEDDLINKNSKNEKLVKIKAGNFSNSVSKCMCDTDDWYLVLANKDCIKSKLMVSLISRSTNLDFEIIENNISKGLLNKNTNYEIGSGNENVLHVFSNSNELINYFIKIEEQCYPKDEKIKTISFVNKVNKHEILLKSGSKNGIINKMKFYFIDNDSKSLKTCFISELSSLVSICSFGKVKIEKLPDYVYFSE